MANCLHKDALDMAEKFISFKFIRCECGKIWTRKEWNAEKHYTEETYDYTLDKARELQANMEEARATGN